MNAAQLLDHWQGHRGLTRKLIEAYPEDQILGYAIGGMRPFAQLVMEMIDLADGGIKGATLHKWPSPEDWSHSNGKGPTTKAQLLAKWDEVTELIDQNWDKLTPARFADVEMAFGMYEGTILSTLLYIMDNEIHHRGQAYVYLRSLGVTPPPFWDRAS